MTNLFDRSGEPVFELDLPVSGGHTVRSGVVQALTSDGYLTFIDDSASLAGAYMPINTMQDNSSGVSGDLTQRVQTGIFPLSGSEFTRAHIGGTCYASGSSTASVTYVTTNTGSNSIAVGEVQDYLATKSAPVKVSVGKRGLRDLDGTVAGS